MIIKRSTGLKAQHLIKQGHSICTPVLIMQVRALICTPEFVLWGLFAYWPGSSTGIQEEGGVLWDSSCLLQPPVTVQSTSATLQDSYAACSIVIFVTTSYLCEKGGSKHKHTEIFGGKWCPSVSLQPDVSLSYPLPAACSVFSRWETWKI